MNHQNLAVSLIPANELNNYTSQGMKNDFLKFSFSTKNNMWKYWMTHQIDNEFLYFFLIAKFKTIIWFKMEVTISRLVHFYHIIIDFDWNDWAHRYWEKFFMWY